MSASSPARLSNIFQPWCQIHGPKLQCVVPPEGEPQTRKQGTMVLKNKLLSY